MNVARGGGMIVTSLLLVHDFDGAVNAMTMHVDEVAQAAMAAVGTMTV